MLPAPRSLLLLASLLLAGLAPAQDYEIKFDRVSKVGDRYRIVATGTQDNTTTLRVAGNPPQEEREGSTVALTAACEVLGVTRKGQESKVRLRVESLQVTVNGKAKKLLPAGAELVCEAVGDETRYLVKEKPVKPEVAEALELTGQALAGEEDIGDDAIFGTRERKKVGDSWPVAAAAAAADFTKDGIPTEAAHVSGQTSLAEVVQAQGQSALRLTGDLTIRDVAPPAPPEMKVQSSKLETKYAGLFPVDGSRDKLRESMETTIEFTAIERHDGMVGLVTFLNKTSYDLQYIRD